jgi:hypothetical protein
MNSSGKRKVNKLWIVTNRGGENIKPLNYFGYRIPVFFTKKDAVRAKEELDATDKIHANQKSRFERQIFPCEISFTLPPTTKKRV